MVESIFVDPLQLDGIENSHANHLIVITRGLTPAIWQDLQKLRIDLSVSFPAFVKGDCPANPETQDNVFTQLSKALKFNPSEIWIDHFRFDGHWEAIQGSQIPDLHTSCQHCEGRDRVEVLSNLAQKVMGMVDGKYKIGYFAVPFKSDEVPTLVTSLGQDHSLIGKIFDESSPMLYHRMIGRSVSYIHEYVSWMSEQTGKPVLPIIQIKDMPDDLPDEMTENDIKQAYDEAIKDPSIGVCLFWWNHALEKGKTEMISRLFSHQ